MAHSHGMSSDARISSPRKGRQYESAGPEYVGIGWIIIRNPSTMPINPSARIFGVYFRLSSPTQFASGVNMFCVARGSFSPRILVPT